MDKVTSIAKGGWHPEKTGSVRGDIKAMVGRGGDKDFKGARERAQAHHSTPLSALTDPASFGPPPKRADYHDSDTDSEDASVPVASSSSSNLSRPVPARPQVNATNEGEITPAKPFRVDTTGLSTANLPKPPVRRLDSPLGGSSAQTPISRAAPIPLSGNTTMATKIKKPGPPLPPRLPPRENVAAPSQKTPATPPPSYSQAITFESPSKSESQSDHGAGVLNQGAISRLGAAGVSVPGFGIGSSSRSSETSASQPQSQPTAANVSELQSRFAALGSAVSSRVAEGNGAGVPPVGKKPVLAPKPTSLSSNKSTFEGTDHDDARRPPPIPMGTKPR